MKSKMIFIIEAYTQFITFVQGAKAESLILAVKVFCLAPSLVSISPAMVPLFMTVDGSRELPLNKGYFTNVAQKVIDMRIGFVESIRMATLNPAEHSNRDHLIDGPISGERLCKHLNSSPLRH